MAAVAASSCAASFAALSISGSSSSARPVACSSFVSVAPLRSCGFLSTPLSVSGKGGSGV